MPVYETCEVSTLPLILPLASSIIELRTATVADLGAMVDLLTQDPIGRTREAVPDLEAPDPYRRAFELLEADPAHLLLVAATGGAVVGTMQLSFIPGLSRRGALRAQIEAVRVHESFRGGGLGTAMFEWAIGEARRHGCALVQLTTDKARTDAIRFYDRLGFTSSHEGLKLQL